MEKNTAADLAAMSLMLMALIESHHDRPALARQLRELSGPPTSGNVTALRSPMPDAVRARVAMFLSQIERA